MHPPRNNPLFHLGKFPVGVVELIIIIELVGAIFLSANRALVHQLGISPEGLLGGNLLPIFTYSFVNRLDFFFIIGLIFFYQFGRAVELQLGRRGFLYLCGIAVIIPPIAMVLLSLSGVASNHPFPYIGGAILHLSTLAAFCIIYPYMPTILRNVGMKWFGGIFLSLTFLSFLGMKQYDIALGYLVSLALTALLVQSLGKATLKLFPDPSKKPAQLKGNQTKGKRNYQPKIKPKKKEFSETKVDKILDKISEHGLHSLTDKERETLLKSKK